MFASFNVFFVLSIFILYLYFFPRSQNRRNLKNISFKEIDKILIKYYKYYFSLFSSLGDFPGLIEVYEDIAYSLNQNGIQRDLLLEYSRDKKKKPNWVISIISLLVSFMGVTELDKLLKVSENISKIYDEHKKDSLIKFLESFFQSETWHLIMTVVSVGIVSIIFFSLFFFCFRADSDKLTVDFGFARYKTLIAEDLCSYFSSGFDKGKDHKLTCNFDYLGFNILKIKKGYRIWIPKSFQEPSFKSSVVLKSGNENKIKVKKCDKRLTYYFKDVGEGWFLYRAEEENEEISGADLIALRTIFQLLFAYADLKEKKNRIFNILDMIVENIRTIENKYIRILVAVFFVIVVAIISTALIIFCTVKGIIYIFVGIYMSWLISTWLVRNRF
ncbi:hypothetical protein [Streptococcus salivarius]|uniref:hypothetical protein n=1 Tax=Streptococcus salivarius TaxID=1304 RepID=UPI001C029D33|nr:hypothetical protein [Streptococcus salivarius]MBT9630026.1 hypothetical protein [Streptococcus salivarius]